MVGRIVWFAAVIVGWVAFAGLALAVPGGLESAWAWVRDLPLLGQIALWLLLLPYMGALWAANASWAPWVSNLTVATIAVVSIAASVPRARR